MFKNTKNRRLVGITLLLPLTFALLGQSVGVGAHNSNNDLTNEHGVHKISGSMTLMNARRNLLNPDSTEQLSGDGHDEVRRFEERNEPNQWEGTFEMVSNEGVSVTRGQKIEAFWAILAAVLTAILSNILTKAAVHKLGGQ